MGKPTLNRKICTGKDLQDGIQDGLETLYKVALTAYGVNGGNVAIERRASAPTISHDGVSNLEELEVEEPIADMAIKVEASRVLVNNTMKMIDAGMDVRKEASITKTFVTDSMQEVTSNAIQVFGGYGYSREYPVEKLMRDAKIFQIFEGTNQIQRLTIAKCLEKEYE